MRDSLLLYRSTLDGLLSLPSEEMKAALTALKEYAMDDKEEDHGPTAAAVLAMTKPLIDANNRKAELRTNRSRQEQERTSENKEEQERTSENREELKEKGERRNIKESASKDVQKKFTPPTLEEIKAYATEKGWNVDDEVFEDFIDFYESKNWMVGRNKMAKWKAAISKWVRSQRRGQATEDSKRHGQAAKSNQYNDFPQRDYDVGALERQLLGGG